MKLFVKLMLALLVLALLLPFTILKDDHGNTLMSFSDFSLSDVKMPDFSMPDDGVYRIGLLVTDDEGLTGTAETEVEVRNVSARR